jgi:RHH-type rel operon transcriptional repressor/antitoxin RelB
MLGVRLDTTLEARLDKLAKATGRSKSYYAKVAIRQFLDEREEYLLGLAVLEGERGSERRLHRMSLRSPTGKLIGRLIAAQLPLVNERG